MFAGTGAAASGFALAHAADVSVRAFAVTWVGLRGTGAPDGFTVTVAFIPGWTLQISWNMPTFGKV